MKKYETPAYEIIEYKQDDAIALVSTADPIKLNDLTVGLELNLQS